MAMTSSIGSLGTMRTFWRRAEAFTGKGVRQEERAEQGQKTAKE